MLHPNSAGIHNTYVNVLRCVRELLMQSIQQRTVGKGLTQAPHPHIPDVGLLYERSSVPTWLQWIEDVSLVNYAFDALLTQQMDILPGQQVGWME